MRRTLALVLFPLFTVLAAACAASSPPAASAPAAENPCAQTAPAKEGDSPGCSEGCKWNGTECRQERSIIVHD